LVKCQATALKPSITLDAPNCRIPYDGSNAAISLHINPLNSLLPEKDITNNLFLPALTMDPNMKWSTNYDDAHYCFSTHNGSSPIDRNAAYAHYCLVV